MIFVAGTMTLNPIVLEDFRRDVAAMLPQVKIYDIAGARSLPGL